MTEMNRVKLYISFMLMLVAGVPAIAQDINFSQFYELPMLRNPCLLYTSPSPRDRQKSRMPSSA